MIGRLNRTSVTAAAIAVLLIADVFALASRSDDDARIPGGAGAIPTSFSTPTGKPIGKTKATGRFLPPVAGTYRYHTQITIITNEPSPPPNQDGITPYFFGEPRKSGSSYIQVVRIGEGDGASRRTNRWARDGLFRLKDTGQRCTFKPPRLAVRFPLRVGDTWTLGATNCREALPPGYRLTGKEVNRVTRAEQQPVGNKMIDCFVIESILTTTATTSDGVRETESRTVQWFSPRYRLFIRVQRISSSESRNAKGDIIERSTNSALLELLDLVPA
jgi:hypothetical protein